MKTMKICATAAAALMAAVVLSPQRSFAAINQGIATGDFVTPTIETFSGPSTSAINYDFGNGLTLLDLNGQNNHINLTSNYGMGTEPSVSGGVDGNGTGFFGTGPTPTTFQLAFAGGVTHLGFYGAESALSDESAGRNAEWDIQFFDINDVLIDTLSVSTGGTPAWEQFHGFKTTDELIGRIVFDNAGHMVLDNIYFEQVPEPASFALLGFGGLALFRRRRNA